MTLSTNPPSDNPHFTWPDEASPEYWERRRRRLEDERWEQRYRNRMVLTLGGRIGSDAIKDMGLSYLKTHLMEMEMGMVPGGWREKYEALTEAIEMDRERSFLARRGEVERER